MTLAMVDSMPERFLRYHPVEGVRDFAQQIAHASVPVGAFAARARGVTPPALGDTTQYLNSRSALRAAVVLSYDFAATALNQMSDADLSSSGTLAREAMPKWRMFDLAHEHSVWTRGELVSYFRLNGMAPPAFQLFGGTPGE